MKAIFMYKTYHAIPVVEDRDSSNSESGRDWIPVIVIGDLLPGRQPAVLQRCESPTYPLLMGRPIVGGPLTLVMPVGGGSVCVADSKSRWLLMPTEHPLSSERRDAA